MSGRPRKKRIISGIPRVFRFSPRGVRGRPDQVVLKMDELEAVRLADLNALRHNEAAGIMGISRQTFERILRRGRNAVADGIVNGKIININRRS